MPDENTDPKQHISAGNASQNYQAGRDIHVHNPNELKRESSIVKPSFEQIKTFDPRVREIVDAASLKYLHNIGSGNAVATGLILILLWVVAIYIGIMSYFGKNILYPFHWTFSILHSLWSTL